MELKPETERLVQEEISRGHVHSIDDLILYGVNALREKHHEATASNDVTAKLGRPDGKKSLVEVFVPLRGLDLDFIRNPSTGRGLYHGD